MKVRIVLDKNQNFLNFFENGYLKKGYEIHIKAHWGASCLRAPQGITYIFKSNFVYIGDNYGFDKNIFKEENILEEEFLFLYDNIYKFQEKEESEEIFNNNFYYKISIKFNQKNIFKESVESAFDFHILEEKLIPYVSRKKYRSPNKKDISNQFNMVFDKKGRLRTNYHIKIEYGMNGANGISYFDEYFYNRDNSNSFNLAKRINTLDRILRYQKDIYGVQENSLIFIKIYIYHNYEIIDEKYIKSFNIHCLNEKGEKSKRKILNFRDLLSRVNTSSYTRLN